MAVQPGPEQFPAALPTGSCSFQSYSIFPNTVEVMQASYRKSLQKQAEGQAIYPRRPPPPGDKHWEQVGTFSSGLFFFFFLASLELEDSWPMPFLFVTHQILRVPKWGFIFGWECSKERGRERGKHTGHRSSINRSASSLSHPCELPDWCLVTVFHISIHLLIRKRSRESTTP